MGFRTSVKRFCMPYIFTIGILLCLVCVYILSLKQSKQIGTSFNLQRLRVKRNVSKHVRQNIDGNIIYGDIKPGIIDNLNANQDSKFKSNKTPTKSDKHLKLINNEADTQESKDQHIKPPLRVYVVEEHHEVIPYWFTAANEGRIPKKDNTLIHIDGHSDMAPVENVPGYPFFKWPSTKQLKYLMQSNDGFIQASAMAGLINRLIWIWPDWDKESHGAYYMMSTLSLGWTEDSNHTYKAFCMCANMDQEVTCISMTDMGYPKANGTDDTDDTDAPGYIVPIDKCRIEKIVIVEEVHETEALSYLKKQNWLGKDENIMLDIDEDYYGCTYAVEPLLKQNITLKSVKKFDSLIQNFVCPESLINERQSEKIFMDIINNVTLQKICRFNKEVSNTSQCQSPRVKSDLSKEFVEDIKQANANKNIRLCHTQKTSLTRFVKLILQYLNKLNINQLKAFKTVGFCLSTSFRTWQSKDNTRIERTFGVCSGFNNPEESAVTEHKTSHTEIKKRSIILKLILKQLQTFPPKLVTVCRSVRDGYTPREHFEEIEQQVLSIVNQTFGGDTQIHYDESLLGGKQGWYHWHNHT